MRETMSIVTPILQYASSISIFLLTQSRYLNAMDWKETLSFQWHQDSLSKSTRVVSMKTNTYQVWVQGKHP